MRRPKKVKCRKSARYPRGEKWQGPIEYHGLQRWVGTFPTKAQWEEHAREVVLPALKAELENAPENVAARRRTRVLTVGEFARVTVDPATDRVMPRPGYDARQIWPWTHRRRITKESSFRSLAEALRPFVRKYEDRRLDSFTRPEARAIAERVSYQTRAAIRRFFGDALDDEIITGRNVFEGLGFPGPSKRDDPNFTIPSDDLFYALADAALESRADNTGKTLRAMILFEGTVGVRPGEIFGIEHTDIDIARGRAFLRQQVDDRGELTPLKNRLKRWVPFSGEVQDAYLAAPRLSERFAYPAPRGGHFKLSNFDRYWHAIRVAVGQPKLQFYDLKHRAITWMVTPQPNGLGLHPPIVAHIVGHQDGGATIAKHYLHLDQHLAVDAFEAAYRAHDRSGGRTLVAV